MQLIQRSNENVYALDFTQKWTNTLLLYVIIILSHSANVSDSYDKSLFLALNVMVNPVSSNTYYVRGYFMVFIQNKNRRCWLSLLRDEATSMF